MKRKIILEIISSLFIFLFVYASVSKLLDVERFRVQIAQSPLLTNIAGLVAWLIPLAELAISVCLAVSRWRIIGLLGSFSLMVMFTAYILTILQFSEHIPCACGGVLQMLGWKQHLIFNIVFVLLAVAGIVLMSRPDETLRQTARR